MSTDEACPAILLDTNYLKWIFFVPYGIWYALATVHIHCGHPCCYVSKYLTYNFCHFDDREKNEN